MMGFVGKGTITGVIVLCAIMWMKRNEKENLVLSSIEESGYVGELHHTITEDGYILGLHRILKPGKQHTNATNGSYPILFVHGLESTALDWIHYQGKESLPYLLLEEGYDVWLGNVRGTQDSFNHTMFDPHVNPKEFWNTSVHEIGYYDLPAMIDHVLDVSNSEKMFYVGMSQGEATFLIMASERPEYNEKIRLATLTAPSSHLKYSENIVMRTLAKNWPILQNAASLVGLHTIPGRDFISPICQYQLFSTFCKIISDGFIGYTNSNQSEHFTKIFQIHPVRSAFKQLLHYLQMWKTGLFRKFDYGREENIRIYGQEEPPEYDIQKIVAPVAYFWGENDCWSSPKDVADIEEKLPNLVLSYGIPHRDFNHYDLLSAKDAKTLVYKKIMETILHHT